jgi:hypothetical protein
MGAVCVPIGGGVGGGVAASAALGPDADPKAKSATAVRPPATARQKEEVFIGLGAFWRAGNASCFDTLVIMQGL